MLKHTIYRVLNIFIDDLYRVDSKLNIKNKQTRINILVKFYYILSYKQFNFVLETSIDQIIQH